MGQPQQQPAGGMPGPGGTNPFAPMAMPNQMAMQGRRGRDPTTTPLQQELTDHMYRSKAMYDQTGKAIRQVDAIRKELEKLADKQDMVTMEDVIAAAGRLVGHGLDPLALAGILADAPQDGGGAALGGWVQSHAQAAMEGEQKLLALHDSNAHEMGVAAAHVMMVNEMGGGPPARRSSSAAPMDGGNHIDEGSQKQLQSGLALGDTGQGPPNTNELKGPGMASGMRFMERQGG